jgi:aspartate carbamoyltransferase catalytic subunit
VKRPAFEHSAIAKGESLYDTARVLSGYSDIIVMRHPEDGSVSGVRGRESRTGDQWW